MKKFILFPLVFLFFGLYPAKAHFPVAEEPGLEVKVYPTQVVAMLTVRMDLEQPGEYAISVLNLLGEEMLFVPPTRYDAGITVHQLDFSGFTSGVYLVKVYSQTAARTLRVFR